MAVQKMFIILPLLMFSRNINFDNPDLLMFLRILYYTLHVIFLLLVQNLKGKIKQKGDKKVIYVPPVKQLLATGDNNLQKTTYVDFEVVRCETVLKQTLVAVCLASFLHFKVGINQIMLLQSILQPMNWFDEPLIKKYFLKSKERVWDEKFESEYKEEKLSKNQEKESNDETENEEEEQNGESEEVKKEKNIIEPELEEALTEAWDAGEEADFGKVMALITKENVNYQVSDNLWTPLMIASGLPRMDHFIPQLCNLGANPSLQDADRWTALHWSVYHQNIDAVKKLVQLNDINLLQVKNNEGMTPIDLASEHEDIKNILFSMQRSKDMNSID